MDTLRSMLFGGVIPGTFITLCLGLAWVVAKRPEEGRRRIAAWVLPAAAGLAFLIVEYGLSGVPKAWPGATTDRIHLVALAGGLMGVIEALTRHRVLVSIPVRLLGFAGIASMLLEFRLRNEMVEPGTFWMQIAGVAAVLLLVAFALDIVIARGKAGAGGLALLVWALVLTPALFLAGVGTGSYRLAGVITPVLTALVLMPVLGPGTLTRAIVPLAVGVIGSLLLTASSWLAWNSTGWAILAGLFAGPLVAGAVSLIPRVSGWRFLPRAALLAGAVGIVAAVPTAMLWMSYETEPDDPYESWMSE